jgi:hypothetical protein
LPLPVTRAGPFRPDFAGVWPGATRPPDGIRSANPGGYLAAVAAQRMGRIEHGRIFTDRGVELDPDRFEQR